MPNFIRINPTNWLNRQEIPSRSYDCWACARSTGSNIGYKATGDNAFIYICPNCGAPNALLGQRWCHRPIEGSTIKHLPGNLQDLHAEARSTLLVDAHTACVILCRKGLMNVAVENGAKEGMSFVDYITFLQENNWVPPKSTDWINRIRQLGNEANHQVLPKSREDATMALSFFEMILRFNYELPGSIVSPS